MEEPVTSSKLTAEGWKTYTDDGFIGLVGPFWTKSVDDKVLYGLLTAEKHRNRNGVVQGGMLATFADRSLGLTAWYANGRKPQATVQLDIQFIDAVQLGEFVISDCKVVKMTRSLLFMDSMLSVNNRVVATARGVWKILKA